MNTEYCSYNVLPPKGNRKSSRRSCKKTRNLDQNSELCEVLNNRCGLRANHDRRVSKAQSKKPAPTEYCSYSVVPPSGKRTSSRRLCKKTLNRGENSELCEVLDNRCGLKANRNRRISKRASNSSKLPLLRNKNKLSELPVASELPVFNELPVVEPAVEPVVEPVASPPKRRSYLDVAKTPPRIKSGGRSKRKKINQRKY